MTTPTSDASARPPSVDALARSLAGTGLPHPLLVDVARAAIADAHGGAGEVPVDVAALAAARAAEVGRSLLTPVVNATGVLLHTNLGRAPLAHVHAATASNLELDLGTGGRGSRQTGIGTLLARLLDAEAAIVVNNGAAAILLVLASLAAGRDVVVSRGEAVEIGGGFRVPEVLAQSGARLVDVGTTNRTRAADYAAAIARPGADVAAILKVHPSNFRVEGFTESAAVRELAALGVPVVDDIGSGLVDATVPWIPGPPPLWLAGEPGARQTLEDGAALVTFSGDKLFGGPQAGVVAGRADLVRACARHPLARALRPGSLVLAAMHATTLAYLERRVAEQVPFWTMATTPVDVLRRRARAVADGISGTRIEPSEAVPGAGSAPGATIPSVAVVVDRDVTAELRAAHPPVVARAATGATWLDLRSVPPDDDVHVRAALAAALAR